MQPAPFFGFFGNDCEPFSDFIFIVKVRGDIGVENHMRYFKTSIPNTKLLLTTGAYVKWDKIDEQAGVVQTNDPAMASEFESAIRREVGGVQEIQKSEYDELKKKQLETPSSKPWREEFGPGAMNQAVHRRSNANAAEAERPKMETVPLPSQKPGKVPQQLDRPKSTKRQ